MMRENLGGHLESVPCGSKSEICLLFDRESNRQRLSDVLSDEYETVVPESVEDAFRPSYNLYVLDEHSFSNHKERIKEIKDDDKSTFRPFLLVTTRDEQDLPQTVYDVVDDVLVIPTRPELLTNRVRNLIDRQKLSQQAVDERDRATSLFQRIFQNSNDAICIADLEHEQVRAGNQAAMELYGYSDGNLESVHLSELYEEYEEFLSFADSVVEEGTGRADDLRCKRQNGETFHVAISSSYVEIDDVPHLINNIRDITDQKEREEERQKSERYRQQLYEITSDAELSFDDKVEQVLELGRERLGVENGHLVQIDIEGGGHVIITASGSQILQAGDEHELATTYCRKTIEKESVLAVHNAPEQGWQADPAFEKHGLASYASSRILVDGDIFGTVCFVDRSRRENPFNEREKMLRCDAFSTG